MKTLTISDVHGRNKWEDAIYNIIDGMVVDCYIGKKFDKVIFLGDYVDSFDKTNTEILSNLLAIINLKKDYPDNVILLLGNHDAAYIYDERCSGFRGDIALDIKDLFNRNINLFQFAFQVDNVIWSHAGLHRGWWDYHALPIIDGRIEKRYTPYFITCNNIADQLNLMQEFNEPVLRMVGHDRGGRNKVGGPLWVDKGTLYGKSIKGYHQVVGHSVLAKIKTFDFGGGTKITFTDCCNDDFYYLDI